jgi:D-alanyl-D-alanine carboxypeptidase (penicillin-binding protein 5/6)
VPVSLPPRSGLRFDQILASWLIAGALLLEGAVMAPPLDGSPQLVPQVPIADLPISISPTDSSPSASISAQSYLVLDRASGAVLAEKAAAVPHYPASTLKLLTALVVLEHWQPTETLTLTPTDLTVTPDIENPLAWQIGETVSIHDLLASLLINSDNLTAMILAKHYPGGSAAFVAEMEQLAQRLSLSQTRFTNPVGLDAPTQQLSAWDLAILAREVLKQPVLAELVQQKTYTVTNWRQGLALKHLLTNTNQLLWSTWEVKGLKTGTTDLAGEVLVSLVKVKGQEIIVVVMGSQDRYLDTDRLLTEISTRYRWQSWADFHYNGEP